VKIFVNGTAREVPDGATVASVVTEVTKATSGVAVALNDEVVSKGAWGGTGLRGDDRIEVLTAVQGG
jgi:sulfur carrier protein